jgi:hypothetical protein
MITTDLVLFHLKRLLGLVATHVVPSRNMLRLRSPEFLAPCVSENLITPSWFMSGPIHGFPRQLVLPDPSSLHAPFRR